MSRMAEIDADLRETGRIADLERLEEERVWVEGQIAETEAWVAAAGDDYDAAMSRRAFLNALKRNRRRIAWRMDEIVGAASLRVARGAA